MSRYQARFVVALVVVFSIGWVLYSLTVTLQDQQAKKKEIEGILSEVQPEVDQRLQNFRRVQMRDGKKVWEIAARQARYVESSGEVAIDAPEVSLYLKDGEVIALRCGEGLLHLGADAQEVTRIELKNDLEIQVGEFSLRTQEAVYDSEQNTISSPGFVQISGRGLLIEGQGYSVNMDEKFLTLNAEVRTTITREEG